MYGTIPAWRVFYAFATIKYPNRLATIVILSILITGLQPSINQAGERREAIIDAYLDNAIKILEDGNHSAAFDMFKKAATEWDSAKGQFMLSMCYDKGFGVDKNPRLAAEFLEKSVNNGDPHAQYRLGMYYIDGFGDYKKDHEKGMKWLLLSAKQGNELAQYHIAMNYLYNKNYSNNERLFTQGLEYLTTSADHGYDAAQYELGKIYLELAQDQIDNNMKGKYLLEAAKYIIAAANQGHEEASKVAVGLEKLLRQ